MRKSKLLWEAGRVLGKEAGGRTMRTRGNSDTNWLTPYLWQSVFGELHLGERISSVGHVIMWPSSWRQLDRKHKGCRRVTGHRTATECKRVAANTTAWMTTRNECKELAFSQKQLKQHKWVGQRPTLNPLDKNTFLQFALRLGRRETLPVITCF